jgi:hypothetical protein
MDGTKYPLNGFNVISQSYSSSVVFRVAGTSEPPAGCLLLSTLFHRGNPPPSPTEGEGRRLGDDVQQILRPSIL